MTGYGEGRKGLERAEKRARMLSNSGFTTHLSLYVDWPFLVYLVQEI